MKKNVYFPIISSCFFFIAADISFAGDYHNQAVRSQVENSVTLACAQCHTMHGTQGGSKYSLIYDGTFNIYPKLLRMETVVSLCKYCHDGDPASLGAPDLFSPSYVASAGDYNSGEGSFRSDNIADNDKRHNIGVDLSGKYPPGYSSKAKGNEWEEAQSRYGPVFTCIYCHDQHGNTNYRNVRPNPLTPFNRDPNAEGAAKVTYSNGNWTRSSSIVQSVVDGSGNGSDPANQFSTKNITFRKHQDSGNVIQIAQFCGKCHVNFFGAGGDTNMGGSPTGDSGTNTQWLRHPVGGISVGNGVANGHISLTNFPTGSNRVRTINPDGSDAGSDEQPFCFTCHRAHGSTNHSNLIFGSPNAAIGGSGTMIRHTCQQCHNQ